MYQNKIRSGGTRIKLEVEVPG